MDDSKERHRADLQRLIMQYGGDYRIASEAADLAILAVNDAMVVLDTIPDRGSTPQIQSLARVCAVSTMKQMVDAMCDDIERFMLTGEEPRR